MHRCFLFHPGSACPTQRVIALDQLVTFRNWELLRKSKQGSLGADSSPTVNSGPHLWDCKLGPWGVVKRKENLFLTSQISQISADDLAGVWDHIQTGLMSGQELYWYFWNVQQGRKEQKGAKNGTRGTIQFITETGAILITKEGNI